jgi:hypothetical protein
MVVDGNLLEGNWEPLIDIETWDTVQDRRRNSKQVHHQRRLARKGPYLLTGLSRVRDMRGEQAVASLQGEHR